MPRSFRRIALVFVVVLVSGLIGCESSEYGDYVCSYTTLSCGTSISSCCNAVDCYYEYNGQRYSCNGTDCSAAATQVVRAACGAARGSAASDDLSLIQAVSQLAGQTVCPVRP